LLARDLAAVLESGYGSLGFAALGVIIATRMSVQGAKTVEEEHARLRGAMRPRMGAGPASRGICAERPFVLARSVSLVVLSSAAEIEAGG
jgi:hypothetical protein